MTIYAVEYTYDVQRTADLAELRPAHREFLGALYDQGVLLASGPWLDNAKPGALLIVRGESDTEVARALDEDPFQRAKLITHRSLRPWNPVFGPFEAD